MKEKYKENLDMEQFKIIKEISSYNHNYYIGFDKDLLFCKSNELDDTDEWWLIKGKQSYLLGYSYSSNNKLILSDTIWS